MISAALSRRLALLTLCSAALGLAACGGGGGSGDGSVRLRALNLSTDLPSVDIYLDDDKQFSALTTDTLVDYDNVNADTFTVKVKEAGDGTSLLSGEYSLSKDKHYTAVVWGRANALRLSTLPEDEDTDDIDTGNSRIRIFNATVDSGSVDVYLTQSTTDISDASPTQGSVASGALSGFRDISSGTWRLRVTGAGDPDDVRLDIASITLEDKKFATLVLTAAGSSGVLLNGTLIRQQSTATALKSTKARVRVAASIANAGRVGIAVGSATVTSGITSPSVMSSYALVDAGSQALIYRVNGTIVSSDAKTFVAGTDYTLLAYGSADAAQLRVISDDNRLPTTTNRIKARLINGVGGLDDVALAFKGAEFISGIDGGGVSDYVTRTLTATSADVDVEVTSPTLGSLFTYEDYTFTSPGVYTVFLLDGQAKPLGKVISDR